ncbi:hypothetical protein Pmani_018496 [Petrolisthes manimaculis]|uniref:Uncharacterized protein n=1 Tax=Petrolisthes manimaculis TaxID=1843537 RepID=A0AAE1U4G8_9EUCA|nr:hypothetical protein Pmani_018496 [Petrolisthes manimaculis]
MVSGNFVSSAGKLSMNLPCPVSDSSLDATTIPSHFLSITALPIHIPPLMSLHTQTSHLHRDFPPLVLIPQQDHYPIPSLPTHPILAQPTPDSPNLAAAV